MSVFAFTVPLTKQDSTHFIRKPTPQMKSGFLVNKARLLTGKPIEGDKRALEDTPVATLNDEPQPKMEHVAVMVPEAINESLHSTDTPQNVDSIQKKEVQISRPRKPSPTLQDLSSILFTRGRLQELGCVFTPDGQMVAYGSPETRREFDSMLHLGPIYEDQMFMHFGDSENRWSIDDVDMWSDLRTLKKMLKNMGIEFGHAHGRLTHGNASPGIMRLCIVYDDLLKLWSRTLMARAPAQSHIESLAPADAHYVEDNIFDDSGYSDGEDNQPSETIDHDERPLAIHRDSGIPRNVGWRFSDDIDETAVNQYRKSMSQDFVEELEDILEISKNLPLPNAAHEDVQAPPPGQDQIAIEKASLSLAGAGLGQLRHGPSPLQQATTPSMLIREELMAPRDNTLHNLGMDAGFMALMAADSPEPLIEETPAKKKGLRGWWRGVFSRN